MENNDKIIQDFFAKHKKEMEDNGFSKRVMFSLPEKKRTGWSVTVIFIIGIVVSFFCVPKLKFFLADSYYYLANIPILYLLLGLAIFPLIIFAVWIYLDKEQKIFG